MIKISKNHVIILSICLANTWESVFLKQKGANIITSSISFEIIEQTDTLEGLKNDKAVPMDK